MKVLDEIFTGYSVSFYIASSHESTPFYPRHQKVGPTMKLAEHMVFLQLSEMISSWMSFKYKKTS